MFSNLELKKLQALVDTTLNANKIFAPDEIEAFVSSAPLISESLFIPKHNRPVKTLRLKKMFTEKFDILNVTEKILHSIKGEFDLRIGLSFLVHCGPAADTIRYYFSIAQRPINSELAFIESAKDADNLLSFFNKNDDSDLLNLAFSHVNEDEVFEKSDFRPRRLVLATFWITKSLSTV